MATNSLSRKAMETSLRATCVKSPVVYVFETFLTSSTASPFRRP